MLFLIIFAFIGGVVTVLSPCILPLLPIILSSTSGGKAKPYGIIAGFIASFTFFTLSLSTIIRFTGLSADFLRNISIFIIAFFGISLLVPQTQLLLERLFSLFSRFVPSGQNKTGFWGGLIIGLSLGLLWTPCVGPILASVITLAVTGNVTAQAIFTTLAYSTGTAIPMLIILKNGNLALQKVPWLVRNSANIQKVFGVLTILTAIAIYFNIDRKFQSYILDKFPQYGAGLTSIEDNSFVRESLKTMNEPLNFVAPEIQSVGNWYNTEPLTIGQLIDEDKVILIDFWTYSCINCIRTLPYLKSWHEKYADDGLVIIGVHTPEFEFEKDPQNLQEAINDFEIKYPVVQDNDYLTWKAYRNRYWPAKYLIDKNGKIRYTHFGEGSYDETEAMIQTLLREAGKTITDQVNNEEYTLEARSPETYLGYKRMVGLSTNEDIKPDEFSFYSKMEEVDMGYPAFDGEWKITGEYAEARAGSSLIYGFTAKNVYLVMRSDEETRVRIYLDGEEQKIITVNEDKLYEIINLPEAGTHVLWLEFLDDGTQAFAFTFG